MELPLTLRADVNSEQAIAAEMTIAQFSGCKARPTGLNIAFLVWRPSVKKKEPPEGGSVL
jgi:hypothetical protein